MAKLTAEDKLMHRIGVRFAKGVVNYRLIEDDDRILVGLSGGKDSLALLELLQLILKLMVLISILVIYL